MNTVSAIPGQPFCGVTVVGVIIYCAVNVVFVVLLNVIDGILFPVPLGVNPPMPFPLNKLQLNDTFGLLELIAIGWLLPPLHNTCVEGAPTATATGWIV
jgi:hypothetical protein